ncbi:hypothetical protein BKA93DRAFT_813993, partial [Sparassis latifolia]
RAQAHRSQRRPRVITPAPRCNDGALPPPHGLQRPAKAQPTSPHPLPILRDARRPTA